MNSKCAPLMSAEMSDFLIQQSTYVNILPSFQQDMLNFISGNFGPFKVNQIVNVPLWLALHLKKTNKCRILAPEWLSVDKLKEAYRVEKENEQELGEMPQNYYELTLILMANCRDDLRNDEEMRCLVEDINRCRMAKIQGRVEKYMESGGVLKLNNISQHERSSVLSPSYGFLAKLSEQ